jgi:3-dehydroquinate dehydratase
MYSARYFGHILMKLEFLRQIFMKIRPVGAEMFHTDRRTEMTKLIVAFHNFSKAPKDTELCIIINKSQKLIWNISDVKSA